MSMLVLLFRIPCGSSCLPGNPEEVVQLPAETRLPDSKTAHGSGVSGQSPNTYEPYTVPSTAQPSSDPDTATEAIQWNGHCQDTCGASSPANARYMWLPIRHSKFQRHALQEALGPALQFVARQLSAGRSVLIHCDDGAQSGSAAGPLVLALLHYARFCRVCCTACINYRRDPPLSLHAPLLFSLLQLRNLCWRIRSAAADSEDEVCSGQDWTRVCAWQLQCSCTAWKG